VDRLVVEGGALGGLPFLDPCQGAVEGEVVRPWRLTFRSLWIWRVTEGYGEQLKNLHCWSLCVVGEWVWCRWREESALE